MLQRPIGTLVDALCKLGARIEYLDKPGFPPLRITGSQLTGNEITLTGNVSSQYISALMMIAPLLPQGLKLHLIGKIVSLPYINLTREMMRQFGVVVRWEDEQTIAVQAAKYRVPKKYKVEGDWTAASYWYEVISLLPSFRGCMFLSELTIPTKSPGLLQGDSRLREIFNYLGVETDEEYYVDPYRILIYKSDDYLMPLFINEDMSDIPDLVQTLAVTCCLKNVPFRFSGIETLRIKETDRIEALITELSKLGFRLRTRPDNSLIWDGERCEPEPTPVIKTYNDHRMAMAFAPACLRLTSIIIEDPEVVTKSYPLFWEDMKTAGFKIKEMKK
jgi:3-phosphoshikimate 1-carboxyvinyltransferase